MSRGMLSPSNATPTQPVSSADGEQSVGGSGWMFVPPVPVGLALVLLETSMIPVPAVPPDPSRVPKLPPLLPSPSALLDPPELPQPTNAATNHPPIPNTPQLVLFTMDTIFHR